MKYKNYIYILIKRHNTELSNYIWELKYANKDYNLNWETKTKPKNNKTCNLCSLGKYDIEKTKKGSSLTKKKKDTALSSKTKHVL